MDSGIVIKPVEGEIYWAICVKISKDGKLLDKKIYKNEPFKVVLKKIYSDSYFIYNKLNEPDCKISISLCDKTSDFIPGRHTIVKGVFKTLEDASYYWNSIIYNLMDFNRYKTDFIKNNLLKKRIKK